ncbi:DUF1178 family protein [Acuticoccus sp. MNP-M23]|uniref:DUF1178 family protein n=1 Tax=Acuticoccus sp. MNP-M23 TaxID=3072793 RepID=UPI002814DD0B|nr:DUF1178 family protein [Acuticoccus sp. MNP-M23]WMS42849.1 DUF1178 family protein [Acuticoccus sp. MNP-M23]
MIHYQLRCEDGHDFDGWFASSGAFEGQRTRKLVDCPVCGTTAVNRALMAPAVRTRGAAPPAEHKPEQAPAPEETADKAPAPAVAAQNEDFTAMVRALREAVRTHGVDVGRAFPEEARRIHYGEAEPRGIYGAANADETRALLEEGIEVLPLPALPEDHN